MEFIRHGSEATADMIRAVRHGKREEKIETHKQPQNRGLSSSAHVNDSRNGSMCTPGTLLCNEA